MPHDRKGSRLKAGDRVTLDATVVSVGENETACNVTLEVDAPSGEYSPILRCNSRSCEKAGESDVAAAARKGFESR